ncbi:MAG: hypothetical protein H6673_05130 [Anaerolineales bacterium]|nr:hypothetical protein [Anaerolineales bacterium]
MLLEIVCQGSPDQPHRYNEDAFVAYQRDDGQPRYVLAAIDGATSLVNFAPLHQYLQTERNGITPAGLAASVTRDALLAKLGAMTSNEDVDPRGLILHANHSLRELLEAVSHGIFDAESIKAVQPESVALLDDPRKIRLFLPAAVVTLATIDTTANLLRFAHAGDTALLICYEDGRVEVPTFEPRMSYESALVSASRAILQQGLSMLETINDPIIRALDRDHRIYHNYVDTEGATVQERGIGVVDGLPELADYIHTGLLGLEGVAAVMLASDGFMWPSGLHETPHERQHRYGRMWARLRQDGLRGYLQALRAEERADANRAKYPRFKLHDDATAVVWWSN